MALAATAAGAAAGGAAAGKGGISLGTVLAIVPAVTGALSALTSFGRGRQQARISDLQGDILRQRADQEAALARERELDFRKEQSRLMALRRARMGASGVEPSSGAPLLAAEDFAAEVEKQAFRIKRGGELTRTRLEQQADLFKRQAGLTRQSGLIEAGSSLLSGGFRTATLLQARNAAIT